MISDLQLKRFLVAGPQSLASNASLTCATIDTYGYEYMRVTIDLGTIQAGLSLAYLEYSDLSNMASPTVAPNSNFGTDDNDLGVASFLPGNGNSNTCFVWEQDLRGKGRYWKPVITGGAATNNSNTILISVWADLGRPHEAPHTAALANFAERLIG
jgi:hypothetical protein